MNRNIFMSQKCKAGSLPKGKPNRHRVVKRQTMGLVRLSQPLPEHAEWNADVEQRKRDRHKQRMIKKGLIAA